MADAMDLPGGPAFPISIPGCGDNGCSGMSLLDYFAGQALMGLASTTPKDRRTDIYDSIQAGGIEAKIAYTLARAMLAERAKK